MTRIIAVTSGKGGVGKTQLSVNLSLQCASAGLRVGLFGADFGLANINLLLNLSPRHTLSEVIAGTVDLKDIVLSAYGVDIIPDSAWVTEMADLPAADLRRMRDALKSLPEYDLMVFDMSSGGASNVLAFTVAAPEVILVITPEPTALTDAYALVKLLHRRHYAGRILVVVNQAETEHQAMHTYEKFREVVRVYQGLALPLLGWIPLDPQVAEAACKQTPLMQLAPHGPAAVAMQRLTTRLLEEWGAPAEGDTLDAFWLRLTGIPQAEPVTPALGAPAESRPDQASTMTAGVLPADLDSRLSRLEAGLAAVMQALREGRTTVHDAAPSVMPMLVETQPTEIRKGRRASETAAPARFVRNAQRATPIDALQLRRVVGRMLVKAMPGTEVALSEPVQVEVEQLHMDADNDFSLRAGRYTRITLYFHDIPSPDSYIEEIFANCNITGCKVRHLGSHKRYWLTSGRDGCILLDGGAHNRNCVRVYMGAGDNPLLTLDDGKPEMMPSLRRIPSEERAVAPAQLFGKFPYETVSREIAGGDSVELFRILRRDRAPLLCAFHHAGDEIAAGTFRERSP